jgi:hypothetical protein
LELKTRDDEIIENFHISPTADFVAYLTGTKLRVYKLDIPPTGDILPKIRRVELVLKPKKVPNLLRFYRHNSTDFLLTATPGLGLKCYQMSPEDNSATPIFRFIDNFLIIQRLHTYLRMLNPILSYLDYQNNLNHTAVPYFI